MNRRFLITVVMLLGISLPGIILVQLFWIRNAVQLQEEQFDKSVNNALLAAVNRIELQDNFKNIADKIKNPGADSSILFISEGTESELSLAVSVPHRENDTIPSPAEAVVIQSSDNVGQSYAWTWTGRSHGRKVIYTDGERSILRIDTLHAGDKGNGIVFITKSTRQGDSVYVVVDQTIKKIKTKKESLEKVFENIVIEVTTDPVPLDQRIKKDLAQDQIRQELRNQAIYLPFEFGIFSEGDTANVTIHSKGFTEEDILTPYKVNLFPNEPFATATFLALKFPDRRAHIYRSIAWLLTSSGVLTLFILLTFSLTLSLILKQKKISEIKSDFINNMTHEFKTPIATISLAADAITNEKVLSDKDQVHYFLGIIKQENNRMNRQVENVLQTSLLDKKDFSLNLEWLDAHDLIRQAMANIRLQIEKQQGSIQSELKAEQHYIETDKMHFTNVIYNLLDNAIKYSERPPVIKVATVNEKGGISIVVEDQGIGMSPSEKSRIFDKFHRVATGNVHNVKGFGLGLSYVKAIVLLHKGEIMVESEVGQGSRFTVWLPGAGIQ